MKNIQVIVADDHDLILKGISVMLRTYDNLEIVGEASTGQEAVEKALNLKPDVVFMDISMPDISGIKACRLIINKQPGIKIIALSQHEDREYVFQFLNAGGSGYMLKNSSKEEFHTAISNLLKGEKYFSPRISEIMIDDLMDHRKERDKSQKHPPVHLTRREKEIIRMIAEDLSNQEIAEKLFISLRTVETHRRNIMQKLNVKSVVALLKYAVRHNLVTLKGE